MKSKLTLVKNGKPQFCIAVSPPQDAEGLFNAIDELITHLNACLKKPLVWFERKGKNPSVKLELNYNPAADLAPQAFRIECKKNILRIKASTIKGVEYGISYFLQEAFGIAWLWPGSEGTVTPAAENISWPVGSRTYQPDWLWRRIWLGGAFWQEDDPTLAEMKSAGVSPGTLKQLHKWQDRNRLGGLNIADGHRWAQICSPLEYGKTNPEYFALVDGKRDTQYFNGKHSNQPCTSNREVVKLTADHLISQFKVRPELDGFSLSVNDGGGFCECEKCRKLDEKNVAAISKNAFDEATNEVKKAPGQGNKIQNPITDRMLKFANDVAARVAKVYPDKLMLFLIYGPYRTPPKRTVLHPNVIAQFCSFVWSHTDDETFKEETATLKRLNKFADKLGIYDYYVNGKNGSTPRGFDKTLERTLKKYHKDGARYFATQAGLDFATGGWNYYLASRLLWDISLDYKKELQNYCKAGFGAAASPVKKYLKAFTASWQKCKNRHLPLTNLIPKLYPENWLKKQQETLKQAEVKAAKDSAVKKRIKFLKTGLEFIKNLSISYAAFERIEKEAFPGWENTTELKKWLKEKGNKSLALSALKKRELLVKWVDKHQDGFWVTAMWFNYEKDRGRSTAGKCKLLKKLV
ncbi:MAG: DUF4838 domain-containing protein [Planctomycetota bacterium]|jgi:hypothetical protein